MTGDSLVLRAVTRRNSPEDQKVHFLNRDIAAQKSVRHVLSSGWSNFWFNRRQCDQMVKLFLMWPLATMKISPTMYQNCQSGLNILPNKNKKS